MVVVRFGLDTKSRLYEKVRGRGVGVGVGVGAESIEPPGYGP